MITMQTITAVGLVYLIGINLAGFIIMGVDKKRAIRGAWRISEASLFLTALLGGALGCTLGMQQFLLLLRTVLHAAKTSHKTAC